MMCMETSNGKVPFSGWFQIFLLYVHPENWVRWTHFESYFPSGRRFKHQLVSQWFQPVVFFEMVVATLPETNIAPENGWLEDEISFWDGLFSGAMLGLPGMCELLGSGRVWQTVKQGWASLQRIQVRRRRGPVMRWTALLIYYWNGDHREQRYADFEIFHKTRAAVNINLLFSWQSLVFSQIGCHLTKEHKTFLKAPPVT